MIILNGIAHIGIRVLDFARSTKFYRHLDFKVIREDYSERVVVLKHDSGVELNLLDSVTPGLSDRNLLMDEPVRYSGYTHLALRIPNVSQAGLTIRNLGIEITEGPVTFGDGSRSIFFRDPDRNVIELSQPDALAKKTGRVVE